MTQDTIRFLVVEDEPTSAAIIQAVLETLGEVTLAHDAAAALEALKGFVPDTILLDISLPDLDGHTLLTRIRETPGLKSVPVIFVTANDAPDNQIRGLDQGALDYLVKPVAPAVLQARMKHHLQRIAEERRIRRLADYDDLTGLHNRRRFLEILANEMERARRYGRTLSFLAVDLDHFKAINDRHGHDVGDDVLQAVGEVLNTHLRNADLSGRLGGEEFGIVLPETSIDGALCVAEKLRAGIGAIRIGKGQEPVVATASFGVANLLPEESLDDLRKRADAALYAAKASGRNRVCAS